MWRFLIVTLLLALAPSAFAQINCNECDTYTGSCSTPCYTCMAEEPDGGCAWWAVNDTNCGAAGMPCVPDNCTSDWREIARENRGTYGEAGFWCWWGSGCTYWCDHHRVDWVTVYDYNECNTHSSYWTDHYCHDYIDAGKGPSSHYQDCCSGFGPWGLDPTYTCNHYHSCS